jgi:O-antigen/teichoic acid export membrane protein
LAIISVAISVVLILGGEQIVTLIFGDKYRGAGLVVAWLSVANAFRIIRAAPAMAAMAKGDTVNLLLTNIVRVVFGMSVMIVVANLKYPFHYIAASAMAGEVFAFFVSMIRLTMVHKVRLSDSLGAGAFALVFVAGAGILLWSGIPARGWWTMTGCVAGVLVLEAMLALLFFGDPRKFLVSLKKDSGGPVKPPAPPMIEE